MLASIGEKLSTTSNVPVVIVSLSLMLIGGFALTRLTARLRLPNVTASTVMTIRQTGAKGDFVDTLLQIVALDDVVGLVAYSAAVSVAAAAFRFCGSASPISSSAYSANTAALTRAAFSQKRKRACATISVSR